MFTAEPGALEQLRSLSLAIDPAAGTPLVVAGSSNGDFEDRLVLGRNAGSASQ